MPVTVNAAGTGVAGAAGTTLDYTGITVAAGANKALVFCLGWDANPGAITSVTWDFGGSAQAMTLIGSILADPTFGVRFAGLYGLVNPTVGNLTLRIVQTNSVVTKRGAIAFNGAKQDGGATTFANFNNSSGTGVTQDLVITSGANDYVVAAVAADSASVAFTAGTELFSIAGDGWGGAAGYRAGASPSQTISVSLAGSPSTRMVGCCIAEAVASGIGRNPQIQVVG